MTTPFHIPIERVPRGNIVQMRGSAYNRILDAMGELVRRNDELEMEIRRIGRRGLGVRFTSFHAQLLSSTIRTFQGNPVRIYSWREVQQKSDDRMFSDVPGLIRTSSGIEDGQQTAFKHFAINLDESDQWGQAEQPGLSLPVPTIVLMHGYHTTDGGVAYGFSRNEGGESAPGTSTLFPAVIQSSSPMGDSESRWFYHWHSVVAVLSSPDFVGWSSSNDLAMQGSDNNPCRRAVNLYEYNSPAIQENAGTNPATGTLQRLAIPNGSLVMMSRQLYGIPLTGGSSPHDPAHSCVDENGPVEPWQYFFYAINPVNVQCAAEEPEP